MENSTPYTVLIADDEQSICDLLGQFLQKSGYTTIVAYDGEQALEQIRNNNVDMVISDIKMPKVSGVDLLRETRKISSSIPVLLTTGYPTLDTAIEALKQGAFDYLTKPFHLEEIAEKVKRALANRKLLEENILYSNLVSLHSVTQEFLATRNFRELNPKIVQYGKSLSKADAAALIMFNARQHPVLYQLEGEFDANQLQQHDFLNTLCSVVNEHNKDVRYSADGSHPLPSRITQVPEVIGSFIAYPLNRGEHSRGVLLVIRNARNTAFSDLDFEIINVLGSQAGISLENAGLYKNLRDNYLKTIRAFALAVEAKDPYTHGHSENVMKYTIVLAKKLGLSDDEIEQIKYAGLLHDVGKIGISEAILNKPGRLTEEEFTQIKQHPDLGARIISDVPFLKSLVPLVLHHHERFDGKGYPRGLAGKDIPYGARILCVCDTYEAMTSDRPYRKAMPFEKATAIIEENKGLQFDPDIAEEFLHIISA
jgi:response regulator RpfG family c-di-GMP phosphodiesterase